MCWLDKEDRTRLKVRLDPLQLTNFCKKCLQQFHWVGKGEGWGDNTTVLPSGEWAYVETQSHEGLS